MGFYTPPVVKNLLIINILFFLAQSMLPIGDDMTNLLGLHSFTSGNFQLYQLFTYMFLHGGTMHLFANMFGIWMFGRIAESDLGSKRFLTLYLVAGVGAGLFNLSVNELEALGIHKAINIYLQNPNPDDFLALVKGEFTRANMPYIQNFVEAWSKTPDSPVFASQAMQMIDILTDADTLTVGASGAMFGILLAFGMLHPNDRIMLLIPPIPMKAKYFVIGYAVVELALGITRNGDTNIAHFAHIGGMVWGWLLLFYWKKSGKIRY